MTSTNTGNQGMHNYEEMVDSREKQGQRMWQVHMEKLNAGENDFNRTRNVLHSMLFVNQCELY